MKRRRDLLVRLVPNAGGKSWWVGNNPHVELVDDAALAIHASVREKMAA